MRRPNPARLYIYSRVWAHAGALIQAVVRIVEILFQYVFKLTTCSCLCCRPGSSRRGQPWPHQVTLTWGVCWQRSPADGQRPGKLQPRDILHIEVGVSAAGYRTGHNSRRGDPATAGEGKEKHIKIWGETALQRLYQDAGTIFCSLVLSWPGGCTHPGNESSLLQPVSYHTRAHAMYVYTTLNVTYVIFIT